MPNITKPFPCGCEYQQEQVDERLGGFANKFTTCEQHQQDPAHMFLAMHMTHPQKFQFELLKERRGMG